MKNSVKAYFRKDYKRTNGENPIYLRLTIDGVKKDYTLNISCPAEHWNEKKSSINRQYENAQVYNDIIMAALKRADDILYEYNIQHKKLTFHDFEHQFLLQKTDSFYAFVENELEINKKTLHNSAGSVKTIETDLSKLKKFSSKLSFDDITVAFLSSYEHHMRSELKNKVNTIHKSLRFIRTFLNRAKRQGLIKNNVFENYRLKTEPSKREYLSIDELQALEALYLKNLSSGAKNTLKYFLFCCYSGLRYSDVKRLRYKDIRENEIYITMHKTKDIVNIPIVDLAAKFIGHGAPNEKIFRVCVSQVANRHLKDIAKLAEIKKDISFHCARHTFATFALSKGIPIEVVSKLLGHKEIATTQLYAKIVDGYKREEMKKLVF